MTILCVEDEKLLLEDTVSMCRELLTETDTVMGFSRSGDALDWIRDHPADVALLDINVPDMNGLKLAAEIKRRRPDTAIIFLTGYSEYALEAFEVHAVGYLLKPVNKERLAAEIAYATTGKTPQGILHVEARTFGNFDVFVDGKTVKFKQAKCKELLAYLIDRQGSDVSRAEAFGILYQDRPYDRSMQKQLDVIIRSLKKTLAEYGIDEIFEMSHAKMRILPEKLSAKPEPAKPEPVRTTAAKTQEPIPWRVVVTENPERGTWTLSVYAGDVRITDLGVATVRARFKFNLPNGWDGKNIYVVFLDKNGNLRAIPAAYNAVTGELVFDSNLVGEFVVVTFNYKGELYSKNFYTELEKLDAVKVQNDASSKAAASILSVSAGAAGIGANANVASSAGSVQPGTFPGA